MTQTSCFVLRVGLAAHNVDLNLECHLAVDMLQEHQAFLPILCFEIIETAVFAVYYYYELAERVADHARGGFI